MLATNTIPQTRLLIQQCDKLWHIPIFAGSTKLTHYTPIKVADLTAVSQTESGCLFSMGGKGSLGEEHAAIGKNQPGRHDEQKYLPNY